MDFIGELIMKYICGLQLENNQCQYLHPDKEHCIADDTNCSFRKNPDEYPKNYPFKKKEKWFEKYYKR